MTPSILLALEHAWAQAFEHMDVAALDQLLAPEFRLSFVNDPRAPGTVSREAWFAMLGRMSFGSYEIHSSHETIFGEVGVINMHVTFNDWCIDGRVLPTEYGVTDIFVCRAGVWQVVQRISAPATEAPIF